MPQGSEKRPGPKRSGRFLFCGDELAARAANANQSVLLAGFREPMEKPSSSASNTIASRWSLVIA